MMREMIGIGRGMHEEPVEDTEVGERPPSLAAGVVIVLVRFRPHPQDGQYREEDDVQERRRLDTITITRIAA